MEDEEGCWSWRVAAVAGGGGGGCGGGRLKKEEMDSPRESYSSLSPLLEDWMLPLLVESMFDIRVRKGMV